MTDSSEAKLNGIYKMFQDQKDIVENIIFLPSDNMLKQIEATSKCSKFNLVNNFRSNLILKQKLKFE
jgi:hypothetical protein